MLPIVSVLDERFAILKVCVMSSAIFIDSVNDVDGIKLGASVPSDDSCIANMLHFST